MAIEQKKRIEFIDLAKGVCILLVAIGHCGVQIPIPGFNMVQMPLFFFLSGLFFNDYGSFLNSLIKKINRILVPFFFFYIIAYIPFYIFNFIKPGLIVSNANGIMDVFNNRQFFNGPLWFLLALFWSNMIFSVISLNIKKEYLRGIIVILLGVFGILLGEFDIFLPCFIDVSLTALPFFYMGYMFNKTDILYPNNHDRYNIIFAVVAYAITCVIVILFNDPYISFHYNKLHGSLILSYIGIAACIVAILYLCKIIGKLPIVSFCGRYSLIILCLHHMIYRPVMLICDRLGINEGHYATAIITIAICIAMIPICIKYIPWFVAQKDLIIRKPKQNKASKPVLEERTIH